MFLTKSDIRRFPLHQMKLGHVFPEQFTQGPIGGETVLPYPLTNGRIVYTHHDYELYLFFFDCGLAS